MTEIPASGLDSYQASDYSGCTAVEGYDDVWVNEETNTLYVGDGFKEGESINLAGLEATYGEIDNVVLDDDDGNTGEILINKDIDSLIIDNDFNTENKEGISGQANANVTISGQDDTLDITTSMDSVIRTNESEGAVGTNLEMNIHDAEVNFSDDSYQNNYIKTKDEAANGLNAHNYATINTDGEVKISGTVTQKDSFEIGESFMMPEKLVDWLQASEMIETTADITECINYTLQEDDVNDVPNASKVFTERMDKGEVAVAAIYNENGSITGYTVGVAINDNGDIQTYFFDADDENGGSLVKANDSGGATSTNVTVLETGNVHNCDPDNTFTINVNSGSLDIENFKTNQVNEGEISTTVGKLDGDGNGFLIQNNLNVNTNGNKVTGFTEANHSQSIDLDIKGYGGDIKLAGGNTIKQDDEEFTHDSQSANISIEGSAKVDVENMNNVTVDDITDKGDFIKEGAWEYDNQSIIDLMMQWIMNNANIFDGKSSSDNVSKSEVRQGLVDSGIPETTVDGALEQVYGQSETMTVSAVTTSVQTLSTMTAITPTG